MSWFSREQAGLNPPKAQLIPKAKPVSSLDVGNPSKFPEFCTAELQTCNQLHMSKSDHENDIMNGKCHYNTLVYTCTHSTPHPNLPNITHAWNCPCLSIGDDLSSNCPYTDMAPSTFIEHATTECPSCVDRQVPFFHENNIVQRAAKPNQYIAPLNRDIICDLPFSELKETEELDPNLAFPGIGNGEAERGTRSLRDIVRDRKARRLAEIVDSNEESITDVIQSAGEVAGITKTEQNTTYVGVDPKNVIIPLSQKAQEILRGIYEKDLKSQVSRHENSIKNEESGNTGAACYDKKGFLILPYKPRPKPAEEKPASFAEVPEAPPIRQDPYSYPLKLKLRILEDRPTSNIGSPTVADASSEPSIIEQKLKTPRRPPPPRTSLASKGSLFFKNPSSYAQVRTNIENREALVKSSSVIMPSAPRAISPPRRNPPLSSLTWAPHKAGEAVKNRSGPQQASLATSTLEPNPGSSLPSTAPQTMAMRTEPESKAAAKPAPRSNPESLQSKPLSPPTAQRPSTPSVPSIIPPKHAERMQRLPRAVGVGEVSKVLAGLALENVVASGAERVEIEVKVKGEREEDWEDVDAGAGREGPRHDEDAEWEMV